MKPKNQKRRELLEKFEKELSDLQLQVEEVYVEEQINSLKRNMKGKLNGIRSNWIVAR